MKNKFDIETKQDSKTLIRNWSNVFKALGDEQRLVLVEEIIKNPGISGKTLMINTHLTQPTLSFHLKHLTKTKIIDYVKDGQTHCYYINRKFVGQYQKQLDYFCQELTNVVDKYNKR